MFALVLIGIALAMALAATRRVVGHGAGGMAAGMAAMMAAMGTGLSVGYAAGMVWDLSWATVVGLVAGGMHGLWMGRRYGPMAALDGAGGGVMGGLMGPMLGVMLLYLPTSLASTAVLMLVLQAGFSAGAVYLVASDAGAAGVTRGWLRLVGRVLGAESSAITETAGDHYTTLGIPAGATDTAIAEAYLAAVRQAKGQPERLATLQQALAVLSDPARRARFDAARLAEAACSRPAAVHVAKGGGRKQRDKLASQGGARLSARRREMVTGAALAIGTGAAVLLLSGALPPGQGSAGGASLATAPWDTDTPVPAVAAEVDARGVQQVTMTLRAGRYEPRVVDIQKGTPVHLTLQAIGDPG